MQRKVAVVHPMIPYDYYIAYTGDNQLITFMYHVIDGLNKTPVKLIIVDPEFETKDSWKVVTYTGLPPRDLEKLLKYSMCYLNSPIKSLIFYDLSTFTIEKDNYDDCVSYIMSKSEDFVLLAKNRIAKYGEIRQEWYK